MRSICVFLILLFALAAPTTGQNIKADNVAKYVGDGRYYWTVYIEGDLEERRKIAYVEYTLHPSFKNPVRRVTNPSGATPFGLSMYGWGEFTIAIKVVYRDGKVSSLSHNLKLFGRAQKSKA